MKKRILIVDDEFGLADLVAEILAESGYDVSIAINGQQALARMAESRPDLVFLDVMMPVLDGPATLRAMRESPDLADVPVIMMTSLPEALPRALRTHYHAVLHKPFGEDALFALTKRLLEHETDA